ncbi:MAG TPA: GntP family permease [Candidatus Competibacteraceae bacterium]|nr:GntP family permease [Candidatus Competibacter denitrificans]HAS86933.1 GntP family permease [Candidatus Competibacteraceae bacterium]HRC69724.1 GntP family permease [Candidatus Competibacter denitrificans]
MSFIIVLGALILLMYVAYKGHSVVLFAPVAALLAVLLTDPTLVAPMYLGVFMDKMVNFVKLYFPVFMLGAVFGKVIELSGYSKSIVSSVVGAIGHERAMLAIVVVCAILTYGGVSLFVVVFAVYPFAAELFRQTHIPKRLIPGTIALGAFTFTMDSLPGTPQIQNIIPTSFFQTSTWAAPWLGVVGAIFIFIVGMLYLNWQRRRAEATGEDYGINLANEPEPFSHEKLPNPILAITPLFLVGILNYVFTQLVPVLYGTKYELTMTGIGAKPVPFEVPKVAAIWAVEAALLMGILFVVITAWGPIREKFAEGAKSAVAGSLLAAMNTASEYGFGGVIAALPGFLVVADALRAIPNPLINEAVTVTALAGITGSASGGMSIALATMATHFIEVANAAGIPLEVLHRVASMASGGMDTLPHNGAVITLLAVTGLTHMQSYKDIFAITVIKTSAVFVVIAFYYLTGIY